MYKKTERQIPLENFYQPFGGTLNPENRWINLSKIIPWEIIKDKYAELFAESGMVAKAKPVRMALGALLIKEKFGFPDEELVEQIRENHYFQYFIGLPEYQDKIPFDPSMMVHFRKRLNAEVMKEINELICMEEKPKKKDSNDKDEPGMVNSIPNNSGIMKPFKNCISSKRPCLKQEPTPLKTGLSASINHTFALLFAGKLPLKRSSGLRS